MPIRFRCTYCTRRLGIATRKAGTETTCPHCGAAVTVPVPAKPEAKTERVNVDDVDQLLRSAATERIADPATQVLEPPVVKASPPPPLKVRRGPPPVPKKKSQAPAPNDRPLFEGDWEELFGATPVRADVDAPKPATAAEREVLTLGDPPRVIVITVQTALMLAGAVTVMLALAFTVGYLAAR